jgi:hypothetical protein
MGPSGKKFKCDKKKIKKANKNCGSASRNITIQLNGSFLI